MKTIVHEINVRYLRKNSKLQSCPLMVKKSTIATYVIKKEGHKSSDIYRYVLSRRDYSKENGVLFRGFNRISILYDEKNTTARVILHFVARFVYVEV